jgi:hypothetical protein
MNQDQVKDILLDTAPTDTPFTLIFSGKESSVVNGLYKPHSREIILHNRNFRSDDQLVYTALHEYAHHLHAERKGFEVSGKAHTNEFWGIFHDLLVAAEDKGHYRNVFDTEPEFVELTRRIKESCIAENGRVMLEFGRLLVEAQGLCERHHMRFEDYVDRALGVPRTTATAAAKASAYNIEPSIGWDGIRMAIGIADPGKRAQAVSALQDGASPASIKARFAPDRPSEDPVERLSAEKEKLERTIQRLEEKLAEVERRLAEAEGR